MNSYELSRNWFDYAFENPEMINPNHAAIYFFAIEHCNRLGWRDKFGFPTQMAMEAVGIKKHQTFIRYFNDLVSWGFFKLVQKSKNQYSSNIISLQNALPKNGKALGKAIINHAAKQSASTGQSNSPIVKPITNNQITNNHKQIAEICNFAWLMFPKEIRPKQQDKKWMETIDKLIRLDGKDPEEIKSVIKWARENDFWSDKFLSLVKLRNKDKQNIKYYDVFNEARKAKRNKVDTKHFSKPTDDAWPSVKEPR